MDKKTLLYNGTKRLPDIFTESQIDDLLQQIRISKDYKNCDLGNWLKQRDITIIATIYILGLRPREACCLRFDDFNLQNGTVKIYGQNNKTKKDRILPVPKILIDFLKEYFQFPRERFWRGSSYLFPSMENNHISSERLKFIFREKCLKPLKLWQMPTNGKVSKIRLYTLRHSRASHILKKQIEEKGQPDLFAIANFLGHGDIRSTQVYLHTDENYMDYLRTQVEF